MPSTTPLSRDLFWLVLCSSLWGSLAVPRSVLPAHSRPLPLGAADNSQATNISPDLSPELEATYPIACSTSPRRHPRAPQTRHVLIYHTVFPEPASLPMCPNSKNRAAPIWQGPVVDCTGGPSSSLLSASHSLQPHSNHLTLFWP